MPLSSKQLRLRAVVSHGITYTKMKKYQRKLLLAKTPEELAKAARVYKDMFFKMRDDETFQKSFVKFVNRFKL